MRGVRWVDTSGAGGTSWVAVEMHRAEAGQREIGTRFRDWGIPTAGSVAQLSGLGLGIIATGGVQDGVDAARALALGAQAVGMARPLLQAQARGYEELRATVLRTIEELRICCLLTGSPTVGALAEAGLVLGPQLRRWVPRACPLRARLLD
jgi:isopentenyl-diphosphate delta-isomerase